MTNPRNNASFIRATEMPRGNVLRLGWALNTIITALQDNAGNDDVGLRRQLTFNGIQRRVS